MRTIWESVTRPWLGALLRQASLCRAAVVGVVVLILGHLAGLSLMTCPFLALTHLPCPGCGMTRSFVALSSGDWGSVVRLQPFAPFFALVGLLTCAAAVLPQRWREDMAARVERFERRTRLPSLVLLTFVVFGLLRIGFFFCMAPGATFPTGHAPLHRKAANPGANSDARTAQPTTTHHHA